MTKIKDINEYANWDSPNIIILIIKHANDKDIEKLISNCYETIKLGPFEMCQHIDTNKSFKEYFIHLLTYENYTDEEFEKKSPTSKVVKALLRQALTTHLHCILSCFNSYNFLIDIDKKDPKRKYPRCSSEYMLPSGESQKVILDINPACNTDPLNDFEIKEILHDIISSYNNNFYYMFSDDSVFKIEIDYNNDAEVHDRVVNKITEYKLLNNERVPSIVDSKTGLKISIGRQIKTLFQKKGNVVKIQSNTFESFKGTHDRLVKALSFEPSHCCWCNPDENNSYEKIKCANCKELLKNLNNFARNSSDNKIKNTNFNKLVTSVSINDVTNLAELRKQRRKILYSFLNSAKKHVEDKITLEDLKTLIDTSFSDLVRG